MSPTFGSSTTGPTPGGRGMAFGCLFMLAMVVAGAVGVLVLGLFFLTAFWLLAKNPWGIPADPDTLTLAFTGLGLAGAALGFVITKAMEFNKERQDRLAAQKRDAYANLMGPWVDLMLSARRESEGKEPLSQEEIRERASRGFFDALMYGSDDVVREFGAFRNGAAGPNPNPAEVLVRMASVLRAIRKDLGHDSTKLRDDEILRMFMNLPELPGPQAPDRKA